MMRVFLITGASIGIVGTLAGLVLGVVVCLNIEVLRALMAWITNTTIFDPNVYYLTRLPADMDVRETASIARPWRPDQRTEVP
jgi:lipoprotein-releasing system permease protein